MEDVIPYYAWEDGQVAQRRYADPLLSDVSFLRISPLVHGLTTEGICETRQFLSIVETRLDACSATIALSFSPELETAAACRVSITLARISLSGKSRPRRSSGMS